ncbi:MAG TPA: glycosyltransferase [Anaerolineales bacterium]|nr:glycosyltransferase [Anaerolineales bacterium]
MRILLVTRDPVGRGANFVRALDLGRAMAGEGHAISLLAGRASPGIASIHRDAQGVEILSAASFEPVWIRRSGWSPLEIVSRMFTLRGRRFDVVHVFGHRPSGWMPASLLRRLGAALVADWSDWFGTGGIAARRGLVGRWTVGWADEKLEMLMARWSTAVTVLTRTLEAMALARGYPARHVLRLTAGANTEAIRPLPKQAARIQLGLDPLRPVVMNLGLSAWDRAGVIEVFSEIARLDSQATLVLVGTRMPLAVRRALGSEQADRWIEVPFVPHDDLGPVLACADVILLPLPRNGMNLGRFPNQAADAMAAGRPLVTNPTGDLGAFVAETGAGLLADEDAGPMAEAAVRLLRDTKLAADLGRNGRRAAVERLAWPILADKVLSLYENLA